MDTRVNVDLDKKWSWIVAIGSMWCNFCIYGLWRSYGILYVGFIDRYGINHQNASRPFLYTCAIYHLIGPIVGILSYRYSLRSLQIIGCFLAAFGVSMVKLSTNFTMVIIGVGIIQGLGLGIIRTLSNVAIQNYFYKYRAIATAISMSGGVLSSFFFPTLASFLLQTTDIENSFLVFGFVIFLALFGIIVQREPRYERNAIDINDTFVSIEKLNISNAQHSSNECTKFIFLNEFEKSKDKILPNLNTICQKSKKNPDKIEIIIENASNKVDDTKKKILKKPEKTAISNLLYVSRKPMFYVISITFVCYNIYLQIFLMTIVDMAKKFESNRNEVGIRLISLFSLADLMGRLLSGYFFDKNHLNQKNVVIICQLILFLSFIFLPNLNNLILIILVTFLIGLIIGIITILWSLLNVNYFGTDKLAILLGLNCFFSGLESLLRPFLIGFYLDQLKSYKYLYYNIAVFSGMVAILWLFEPLLHKKKK